MKKSISIPASANKLPHQPAPRRWPRLLLFLGTALILLLAAYLFILDHTIRARFEGLRWDVPARVYARPLELYAGLALTPEQLEEELVLAGYHRERPATLPGSYELNNAVVHLRSRPFDFGEGLEPSHDLRLTFGQGLVERVEEVGGRDEAPVVRLDPVQIGSFHPRRFEDRIVVSRDAVPKLLVDTLLAVEDRNFYRHPGIDPLAVLRALWVNLRANDTVQGGSTITQQLVKNLFLDSRRTLIRKLNEAAMAMLLERHYGKEEILTAYINEVFLGQDGDRAVHGFALASHFYFRRDLAELSPGQTAMLVGLVKGPSYYDPRQHAERCRERRALVLATLAADELITPAQRQTAVKEPILDAAALTSGINRFPAFLNLVKRELLKEYQEKDLTDDGIRILTTFDTRVQLRVEKAVKQGTTGRKGLQAAAVVTSRDSGEIQALAGDRQAGFAGFNRALDAARPIGSLVKPAVYLTALGNGYTLASPLEDRALSLPAEAGKVWRPENYDHQEHGTIPLFQALAHSYNLATVRLGMTLGVDKVADTLGRLGVTRAIPHFPSLLLGAIDLTPLEVTQIYQTMADGGFLTPLRAIRTVLAADGQPLKRYGLVVEQRCAPTTVFLLDSALVQVVASGTGQSLAAYLPPGTAAGKTGTSNDLRDSWFAGFTGDRVAVVWVGRDDNTPMGLTGATGALPIWGRFMQEIGTQTLELVPPPGIVWARVEPEQFANNEAEQWSAVTLPFLEGSAPTNAATTQERHKGGLLPKIRSLFGW